MQYQTLAPLFGLDPGTFEYTWLLQQYGYAEPFSMSIEINDKITSSISIPDNCPPEKPPTPPSNEPPGNPSNPFDLLNRFNPFDPGHTTTNIIASKDPNDILGPQGYGAERWISAADPLNYTIRFENDPELATAPAQVVRITQQLDSDLDFRTFRLDDFGFGDTFIDVPDNRAFYQTRLDLTATKGIYVDVIAGVDIATGQAFWEFTSIDPATGVEPTNPLLGFLPPDLTSPEGEGFVSYSVRPKSSIENGAVIDAQACIIFDINEPIDTPAISNTIDTGKPTSTVNALPSNINDTSFQVTWSGSDNAGGSALADFTIYVSDNGKSFVSWLENTTLIEATFSGQPGHTYAFYSVARDNAGNAQEVPTQSQASTKVANGNNNPALAVNQGLTLNEEGTADITTTQLQITDADNTAAQIIYTLTNLPIHGSLKVNGTALTVSNTFTQADIDNNRLTYTHDGSETTSDSFNFTVADGAGGTIDSTTFNITVNPVNDAPTLEKQIADQTATEDSAFSFTIKSDTFKDVDAGDYLTYSATIENGNSLPSWLTFDAVTGSFNGIPGNADVGSLNLKVTATDTNGAVVADTFTLSVANVNDAPTLEKAIANQTATQNTTFSFTFAEDTFKDVDVDDSLSYSATLENGSPLPNWLTFDTTTHTFNGTPSNADVGNIRVKLVALDKTGATATATLGLEVIKLNNTPVATDDAAITLENQAVTISATKLLVNDKDIDGDILKISNVGNAIRGSVAFNQDGDVVFTPAANFTGKTTFEYTVSDGNGGSDIAQVIVNVNPDNNIKGTSGRDVLTGNDADNIITGFQGQDILTGGGGNDQFVYTNIRDAGDTITDFQVGFDKIVITELLKSLGYSGSNPIADSYVKFGSSGNNAILQIDPDGNGSQRPTSLVTLQNLTVAQLSNTNDFLF
ncbi:MAG: tandem-95 repeat protein [Nostoc desertorum CM1-VF14]|nr:tandem-95 repeat protein [Nostoc desertorum CM1-VF14]